MQVTQKHSSGTGITNALVECEQIIERGLGTFVVVGAALLRIRDDRLYRETHGTFEDYCRERWHMSKPRAHRLIQSAEIAVVVPIGTESQARELAPLKDKPEVLREVWQEVQEVTDGAPTAAAVREVVERRREPVQLRPEGQPTGRRLSNARAIKGRLETVVGTCSGYARGLPDLKVEEAVSLADDPGEVAGWIECLRAGERALRDLRKRLETGGQS